MDSMTPTEALRRLVEAVRKEHPHRCLRDYSATCAALLDYDAAQAALAQNRPLTCEDVGCQCAQAALGAGEHSGALSRSELLALCDALQGQITKAENENADIRARLQAVEAALVAAQEGLIQTGVEKAAAEAERDVAKVERDGAVTRSQMVLQAKDEWADRARASEAKASALATALARYGRHEADCEIGNSYSALERVMKSLCTCGLDTAVVTRAE